MYAPHDDRLWEEVFALLDRLKEGKANKRDIQEMREILSLCRDVAEIQLVMSKAVYTGSQAARMIDVGARRLALTEGSDEPS